MRVGIITFHRADNYGAILQSFALLSAVESLGCETEIVDYRSIAIENTYKYHYFPPFCLNPIYYIKTLLRNIYWNPKYKIKARKCEQFRKKYYKMSKSVYLSDADRRKVEKEYDVVLTGSDQIWNSIITHGKDDWYAFEKNEDDVVIASYAASVGNISVFRKYFRLYKSSLEKYDFISVRELNVKNFLQERLNSSIFVVMDPVMLFNSDFWRKIAKQNKKIVNPYIFYFDAEFNPVSFQIACKLAEKYGMNIWTIDDKFIPKKKYIKTFFAGPSAFLGLIQAAKFVVSSSFHAIIFSIIFHKQFVAVAHPKTGDRTRSILQSIDLSDYYVDSADDFDINTINKLIDWTSVEEKLDALRKESFKFLSNCFLTSMKRME